MVAPIFLVIALAFGSGAVLSAESALPGSVLYPVKGDFNESVRGAFAFSGEAKANWEARLAAAETILATGKLSLNAEAYGDAFVLFSRAHQIAQEAKLLVAARESLDVDVRLAGEAESRSEGEARSETRGNVEVELGF